MNNNIVITQATLDVDKDSVFALVFEDEDLTGALAKYLKENVNLEDVFEVRNNISATSFGYIMAFYERDLIANED
jgi:hypothetical protein